MNYDDFCVNYAYVMLQDLESNYSSLDVFLDELDQGLNYVFMVVHDLSVFVR